VNPRDLEALTYAGWLSFLAGAQKQAVPLLQTAVRIQPSYPDAHAFLGIVLLRSHQQPEVAMAQLRQYLRLVPSGQMSQQVRRVLQVATKSSRTRGTPTR
jgi:Flp pilus assembly protein TadD